MIEINETYEEVDLHFEDGMDTEENREYIKENWDKIITNQEELLEDMVDDSSSVKDTLMTIRDNQGECYITNDDGEEIASFGYYADINI